MERTLEKNLIKIKFIVTFTSMKEDKRTIEELDELSKSIKPTREELIEMLDEMNNNIERLPAHALIQPINHYDLSALLILLSAIFKAQ